MAQHLDALATANRRREHQAAVRRDIAGQPEAVARDLAAKVIIRQRTEEAGMRVEHLLTAIPGIGKRKAHRLLLAANVTRHDARLRELTPMRRQALVEALTETDELRWAA